MKKLIWIAVTFLTVFAIFQIADAATTFPFNGGTGSTTLSGILLGNGTSPVNTLTIGSNLTLSGTTLSATGGGSGFSTTSADFWILQYPKGFFFSTTSANYWKTQITFTGASTTLLSDNNTFSGNNIFSKPLSLTSTTGTTTIATGQGLTIGTNQLILQQSSGRVGIGTASPLSLLDVLGDYPSFRVRNFDAAQYSGAGFYLTNTAMTGLQAGYSFYGGINDAADTQGYLAIDQTNTAGGGTGHLMLFTGTTSTEIYSPLLVNGTNAQLTQDPSGGYLNFQQQGGGNGQLSILQVLGPYTAPQEATLTLTRATSSTATNREFTDITDENYGGASALSLNGGVDHAFSINITKQGTGTFRPLLVRFWNQDLGTVASTSLVGFSVVPNTNNTGTVPVSVNVGIATSSPYGMLSLQLNSGATTSLAFVIASSTPTATTTLFSINNAGSGFISNTFNIGTTSINKLFTVEGAQVGGISRFLRDVTSPVVGGAYGVTDFAINELAGSLANFTGPTNTFGAYLNGSPTESIFGSIIGYRDGADTNGGMEIQPVNGGVSVAGLVIDHLGESAFATTTLNNTSLSVQNVTSGDNIFAMYNALGTNVWATADGGTSTVTNGFNITKGCFSINNACIGNSSASSTLLADNNWWTGLQKFNQASSSQFTATSSIVASYLTAYNLVGTDANDKLVSTSSIADSFLVNSPATAGAYTNANITINAQGIVTAAANGSGGVSLGYTPWGGSILTYQGTTTIASTTPAYFQTTLFASSTVASNASTTLLTVYGSEWHPGLTASRLLALDNNNALVSSSTIDISYFTNNSGYLTGNQTVTLTGAVSGSGATNIATTFNYTPWGGSIATNYGTSTIATTTMPWMQVGLSASSTSYFVNSSTTQTTIFGSEWYPGITASRLLALDNNGLLIATTSIGTNLLTGTLATINTQAITPGGTFTLTAASSSLLGDNNTFSGNDVFTKTVGIGTTTPWAVLSVKNSSTYTGNPAFVVASSTGASTESDSLVVAASGNVGINGTSTPGSVLSINYPYTSPTQPMGFEIGSSSARAFSVNNMQQVTIDGATPLANAALTIYPGFCPSCNNENNFRMLALYSPSQPSNNSNQNLVAGTAMSTNNSFAQNYYNVGAGNALNFWNFSVYNTIVGPYNAPGLNIATNNNIGVGTSTAMAFLSVSATTTSGGQSLFTVGSTTVNDFTITNSGISVFAALSNVISTIGSWWYDATQQTFAFFGGASGNGIKETVEGTLMTLTAQNAIINSSAETSVLGINSGISIGTTTLPSNFWVAGKTVHVVLAGVYGTKTVTPGNLTLKVKWGSTILASETLNALASAATAAGWSGEVMVTCLAVVSNNCSFSVGGHMLYAVANPAATNLAPIHGDINNLGATTSAAINSAQRFDITATWATADPANIATTTSAIMTVNN